MAAATDATELEVDGQVVRITHPDKVWFPARGETKLDLAHYYVAVGEGALRGVRERWASGPSGRGLAWLRSGTLALVRCGR